MSLKRLSDAHADCDRVMGVISGAGVTQDGHSDGIMGLLQALEAARLIAGFGTPLHGKLLSFDARTSEFTTYRFERNPGCPHHTA